MKISFKKEFGARIRFLREVAGLSQEKLAERVGLSQKTISNVEQGKNTLSFNRLPIFAQSLGVPVYKLFVFSDFSYDSPNKDELVKLLESAIDKELNVLSSVANSFLALK